ncbi:MAG: hypothetical protein R3279_03925 [Putridiphycobacter sp.]|nr:hypothetical protein [Putridiphycobacter sp.]
MRVSIILLLVAVGSSCLKDKKNQCDPMWLFNVDTAAIPKPAEPSKPVLIRLNEYLNPDSDNSGEVLYYFEVPTIFENPQGDIGKYVSDNKLFYYQLKDTINPPREVSLFAKPINECNPNYPAENFVIVYDTAQ